MAINFTSNYVGEVEETIFTLTVVGNQAVEKGSVYVEAGVQDTLFLPRFNTAADSLQDRVADPDTSDASDSMTWDERSIEPLDAMFYDEFNPRTFENDWRPFQPTGPLVDRVVNPLIQTAIMTNAVNSVGTQIGKIIWQGDTVLVSPSPLRFFDGFIKILDADGAIAPTPAGPITAANVIDILELVVAAIPDAVYDDHNMVIHMSTTDIRLYKEAARALDFKGSNISDAGDDRFAGFEIRSYSGMGISYIIAAVSTAGKDSNLWAAVDVANDDENPKIARTKAASELFFIKILLKYGVNCPNPTQTVLYSPA
jgi:hypothetical protein